MSRRGLVGGLISAGVKGVAGGIGLASEGIHAYKESKKEKKEREAASAAATAKDGNAKEVEDDAPPPYEYPAQDQKTPFVSHDEKNRDLSVTYNEQDKKNPYLNQNEQEMYEGEEEEYEYEDENDKDLLDEEFTTEEQWDLDDAQDELIGSRSTTPQPPSAPTDPQNSTRETTSIAEKFILSPPPPATPPITPLPPHHPPPTPPQRPHPRLRPRLRAAPPNSPHRPSLLDGLPRHLRQSVCGEPMAECDKPRWDRDVLHAACFWPVGRAGDIEGREDGYGSAGAAAVSFFLSLSCSSYEAEGMGVVIDTDTFGGEQDKYIPRCR
jgi:hypothetical protein